MSMMKNFVGWIDERYPLMKVWNEHLAQYYAPKNFNVWYLFGSLALKRGRRRGLRIASGIAAIGCYLYIVAIALTRDPTPALPALLFRLGLT
jgi:CHASE2 domain-containing sensor protein